MTVRERLRALGAPRVPRPIDPPLRSELFSAEQMESHGKALAAAHRLSKGRSKNLLLRRLDGNEAALREVWSTLTSAVAERKRITPAGEWVLDNFYLIEELIRMTRRHLPREYSRELPRLADGPSAGHPRVYDIALETISHGDGRVDADGLRQFVASYQTKSPLNLGELWAIPIMLRLAIIENLRRVGAEIAEGFRGRSLASAWADQMSETAEKDPAGLILVVADMARSSPPMSGPFVAELARRLQGRGPALALPLKWMEQRLAESGHTVDQLVRAEIQAQARSQVSVSNSIGSARTLAAIDWRTFVENLSVVEFELRQDPGGVYAQMDFVTRDRYRHVTEALARRARMAESEVARAAVRLAAEATTEAGANPRARHVGYFLVDRGLEVLERAIGLRLSRLETLSRAVRRSPLPLYLGATFFLCGLFAVLLAAEVQPGRVPDWVPVPLFLLLFLGASPLSIALVNWWISLRCGTDVLPRMDFSLGIPQTSRTLVVVPSMLQSAAGVLRLVEDLEVRFLANRDEFLHFALLTDFVDADLEDLPGDATLARLAAAGIEELNLKHHGTGPRRDDIFFLFHRGRRFNPQEKVFMGYERKRGKLEDLNRLLRDRDGTARDRFVLVVGDLRALASVKYVITLDTDTSLPHNGAQQLAGAMAHPLNRPRFDVAQSHVVEGHAILQPRVTVSLRSSNGSHFARLYGGEPGLDPYTRAVSDMYQDLFHEGSFVGKGIYDVDVFDQALRERLPENQVLSHDLLEGCYTRSGFLSDVQLHESFPIQYRADVSRRHRWIRGDWQLVAWLRWPGPLSFLSQWKLLDNLRRSVVPAVLTFLLVAGWVSLLQSWFWTGAIIVIFLGPALLAAAVDLIRWPSGVPFFQHVHETARSAARAVARAAFEIACLPYEAFFSLDAIARTLWRLLVSRRRLLEWKTSSDADRETSLGGLLGSFRAMWFAPCLAVLVVWLLLERPGDALETAAPVLLLWSLAPAFAWWISLPTPRREVALHLEQKQFLRGVARRTWAFFETMVGPLDHFLPPDNWQPSRGEALAHRTSPTNIGLSLLANVAAYDFGYLPGGGLVDRTAAGLSSLNRLERHRGHFYNWYDTLTLEPLHPRYVSTVDSGNLTGHLLTLRGGLSALVNEPIVDARMLQGFDDSLHILEDATKEAPRPSAQAARAALRGTSENPGTTLRWFHEHGTRLCEAQGSQVPGPRVEGPALGGASESEGLFWEKAIGAQSRAWLDELNFLAPWLDSQPVPEGLNAAEFEPVSSVPTLSSLAGLAAQLGPRIAARLDGEVTEAQRGWLERHLRDLTTASVRARERLTRIDALVTLCDGLARMEFGFLYDETKKLLAIGYNVSDRRVDVSSYDLLASEARLANFIGIAQGLLPQESWFALGRLLTGGSEPVLLSWSGSMFEYLMPMLVMPSYENTLLDETCRTAVDRQIEYGTLLGVPWGISESAYNTMDAQLNYQYRAFGVPGLGLKRGLADDLVIAPYATALALMVRPSEACQNLERLAEEGVLGRYGFFEAVDYTPARQQRGKSRAIIVSYMAHHQGMSLLALGYTLLNRPMQRRFEANPEFQSAFLLLQERIPKSVGAASLTQGAGESYRQAPTAEAPIRVFTTPETPAPEVQLLSNGRYHVMVTNAGGGYSRFLDLAVTRFREDPTRDCWGAFCYVRDCESGTFWSNTHQPALVSALSYEAIFSEGRAEFRRHDAVDSGDFETHTDIVVSPEDDIELRRVRITNRTRQRREIDVTSYAEVVIAPQASDAMHPAFSNLFVQTELIRERRAILCTRRPRSTEERSPWLLHLMSVHDAPVASVSYETDRLRFLGRGRSPIAPSAMLNCEPLSNTEGSVLDPIVSIRSRIELDPGQTVTVDIVTGVTHSRELALGFIEKYQDRHLADRVFELSWTHSQVVLRQLNATVADAQIYARLASRVIYASASLRADAGVLIRNRRGQSGLWGYAISGDLPIVLLRVKDGASMDIVKKLVQAHAYWRLKGLAVDLVIWNEDQGGYLQALQDRIVGLIASGVEASVIDRPGGIFVRPAAQISGEDKVLLQSVARVVIVDADGPLAEQLDHGVRKEPRPPRFVANRTHRVETENAPPPRPLILANGLGGFTPDGTEYVITLGPGQVTPAPWVNVIANPEFGTITSEAGSAYTWSENAHEYRLSPWHNDPVSDQSGEAIYLRDEESGHVWSPTPLPLGASSAHVVRHGFGYTVFESRHAGIASELSIFVAIDAPVKFSVLKLKNVSGRTRHLSATAYVEWVLGDVRARSALHIVTEVDGTSGALFARNSYSAGFGDRVAFLDVDDAARSLTGDRTEFLGRNGWLGKPAALGRSRLSGAVGAGLEPCGALQVLFELGPGQEHEVVFRLGACRGPSAASQMARRFQGSSAAREAMTAVRRHWTQVLGAVQVETPDPSLDVLANGWLVYQTMACRIWARSGYYQSGGAFGFRDQLQDAQALVHTRPDVLREQILLAASRQFTEGDVQHWWHPPSGRGVRTRCSDDYLWLPLAVARYLTSTNDAGVLDESVRFLEGRPVNPGDDSYFDLPVRSAEASTLYEHCVRAIRHGLRFGERGLPLMGSGDWNDGMNLVGIHGKGESVWLGFFLHEVLRRFAAVATRRGDSDFEALCETEGTRLRANLDAHGWDGGWYRRAYFDDGTPLGSLENAECRIDSISQSWAVLSGATDPERARLAMKAVREKLVLQDAGLVQLLDPPFSTSSLNPGYIRGYVPGVRENGGQYTHAAVWAAMACAEIGDSEGAWSLTNLINPVRHGQTPEQVGIYRVEPYVMAADVYAVAPHTGRGGWTWYTGSAGWMYRLLVESLLGLRLEGETLHLNPCLPKDWKGFSVRYRYRDTMHHIVVSREDVADVGVLAGVQIPLRSDGAAHRVDVKIPRA